MRNDTGNDVSVPPTFSINVTLPQNTVKVYAELYASGNGEEEFWVRTLELVSLHTTYQLLYLSISTLQTNTFPTCLMASSDKDLLEKSGS